MKKVGYLGPEGTFSEEAGKLYQKSLKEKVALVPFETLYAALVAAEKKRVDEIIVPIENSIDGTIGIVTDMLAKDVNLKIKKEIILPVYQYLLARKGVKLKDITAVISHAQPLGQCKDFLRSKIPNAKLHVASSTSEAARQISKSFSPFAAIGPLALSKLYGLNVIAKKINPKDNKTRFVVLSKADSKRTGKDKTSIVFSLPKDRPGGLYEVLLEFAKRKINLTKIESRPAKKALGDYYFFLDLQGHKEDPDVLSALNAVKSKVAFYKLLGSYPRVAF